MKRSLLWSLVALSASAATVLGSFAGDTASAARWGENYFPNRPVVTHQGETVDFYDDLIKGRIVVIDFIYTNCPDLCSLTTARLANVKERVEKELGDQADRIGKDIFFYSITLDPANDTPEVLAEYAKAFSPGPGWLFLTGKPKDVHLIRWKLGERSRTLAEHRSDMVLGNDKTGEWRRISAMGNMQIVAERIVGMDPELRDHRTGPVIADLSKKRGDYRVENRPGEAIFLKACSSCHTIGKGEHIGPDLQGVTARRDHDWLVDFLVDPYAMLVEEDPIAVALDARYPGVKMPYLGLSEADAEDIIVYLKTRSKQLSKSEEKQ